MSLFRRQIEPDHLDAWKDAKVDAQIAEGNEREELRNRLCEALGWIHRKSVLTKDSDRDIAVHPFDANLIQAAKALLTTVELRIKYAHNLADYVPALPSPVPRPSLTKFEWALTQSTEVQQAKAILEAIKQ